MIEKKQLEEQPGFLVVAELHSKEEDELLELLASYTLMVDPAASGGVTTTKLTMRLTILTEALKEALYVDICSSCDSEPDVIIAEVFDSSPTGVTFSVMCKDCLLGLVDQIRVLTTEDLEISCLEMERSFGN